MQVWLMCVAAAGGSFGILLWELAARKSVVYPDEVSPFDIATVVIAGKRPAIPDSCPKVPPPLGGYTGELPTRHHHHGYRC